MILWGVAVSSAAAQTDTVIDCRAVNFGALDVTAQPSAGVSRDVTLVAGDKLTVTLPTAGLNEVSVTLSSAAGTPLVLLSGHNSSSATFHAPRDDTFKVQFDTDGTTPVTFTAFCNHAGKNGRAARKAGRLATSRPDQLAVPFEVNFPADPSVLWGDSTAIHGVLPDSSHPAASGAAARGPSVEIWMQWRDQRYAVGASDGPLLDANAGGVNIGMDYKLMPDVMLGAVTQFDAASEAAVGGPRSLSDQAWMIGPTTTVQFAPGLSLDARAAWGSGERETAVAAAEAASERRLLNARFASMQSSGPWRLTPSVNFNYLEETHHGVRSLETTPITAGSGRIDLGPEIAYRVPLQGSAFIEPKAVIARYWDFDSLSHVSPDGAHLKAEAGVTVGTATGAQLQAIGGLDTGSVDTGDIWSGRFQLNVPLK